MNILLVEDSPESALLFKRILSRSQDVQLVHAETGQAALHEATAQQFDIIFLDFDLPDTTGPEVCARLRQDQTHVPIEAMTALDEELAQMQAAGKGFTAYLTKPFRVQRLLDLLDNVAQGESI